MGVDRLDFPLAQPEKPSTTSGRIFAVIPYCLWGGEKEKGQKSNNSWNF